MRTPTLLSCAAFAFCGVAALALPRIAAASDDAGALLCQESPCTTDSDCGAGMRCQPDAVTSCTTSEDSGADICGPATLCEPIWDTTCSQDSDCGDGFACAPQGTECDCGSGSGVDIPDAAVSTPCGAIGPTPPTPPCDAGADCIVPPSICSDGGTCLCWQVKTCQQQPTAACTSAADCPALFSCASGACQPPCANLEVFGGGASGGAVPVGDPAGATSPTGGSTAAAASTQPGTTTASCAVASGPTSSGASPSLLALALGLMLGARRRRRAA